MFLSYAFESYSGFFAFLDHTNDDIFVVDDFDSCDDGSGFESGIVLAAIPGLSGSNFRGIAFNDIAQKLYVTSRGDDSIYQINLDEPAPYSAEVIVSGVDGK